MKILIIYIKFITQELLEIGLGDANIESLIYELK